MNRAAPFLAGALLQGGVSAVQVFPYLAPAAAAAGIAVFLPSFIRRGD